MNSLKIVFARFLALLSIALSGCQTNKNCKKDTIFVDVSLSEGAATATELSVAVVVDDNTLRATVPHTAGKANGGLQIEFAAGYPRGKTAVVTITATIGDVGYIGTSAPTPLGANCVAVSVDVELANTDGGADFSAADQGDVDLHSMPDLDAPDMEPSLDLTPSLDLAAATDLSSPSDIAGVDMVYVPLTWTAQTSGLTGALLSCATAGTDAWVTGMPAIVAGSINSGTDWTPITLPAASASPFSVTAVSSAAVYIAGVLVGGQTSAKVYKSTNKVDFTEVYTSLSKELTAIHGPANNLFAVGKAGLVIRSTNTGSSWPQQNTPSGSTDVSNVYVAPDGTPFVTVGQYVYRSPDGGTTWLGKKVLPDGATISDITGVDESNLWVIGNQGSTPYVYKSNDGNASWDPVSVPSGPTGLSGVFARSKDEVVIVGAAGAIIHFYNGSMHVETSGVSADLNAVCGLGATKYLAVGKSGTIVRGE